MNRTVYVGWDPREAGAFAVAKHSIQKHLSAPLDVRGLLLDDLIAAGLHKRPMKRDDKGKLIDVRSIRADYDGSISTEHANARFFVLQLVTEGWVLFMDGDMLARTDLNEVFEGLDPKFAAYCVKHDYQPTAAVKMDARLQTRYPKKNWSSFVIFNRDSEANKRLTVDMLNVLPGRDLHQLCWLQDEEIGGLDESWNWLVGHSPIEIQPRVVHFTSGTPEMAGYGSVPYANEWKDALAEWARNA